jgi:DNA polymerase-4
MDFDRGARPSHRRPSSRRPGPRQLTFDAGDDKPLAIEAVAESARARYGRQVLYPAALATSTRGPLSRGHRDGRIEDGRGRRGT